MKVTLVFILTFNIEIFLKYFTLVSDPNIQFQSMKILHLKKSSQSNQLSTLLHKYPNMIHKFLTIPSQVFPTNISFPLMKFLQILVHLFTKTKVSEKSLKAMRRDVWRKYGGGGGILFYLAFS